MFKHIRNMHPIAGVVVGVVGTLVLSGTAIAVTDTSFTYSTVKTGHYTIHPMDLTPRDSTAADSYTIDNANGSLSMTAETGGGCYNTGVNLPNLAKITTMQTYYRGQSGTPAAYLVRNNLSADTTDYLVARAFGDVDGVRKSDTSTVPAAQRTVWNNVYAYGFVSCLGVGDVFEGARITYTYTSAGD